MKINLDDIVEAIQLSTNGVTHFLNTRTGDIIMQNENFSRADYNDVETLLDEQWEDIVEIPTNYDADAFGMMRDFIWDLPRGQAKDALRVAIKGQGAFSRFRDVCRNFGLLEDWRQYEQQAYLHFAREWCQENELAYDEKIQVIYTRAIVEDIEDLITLKMQACGPEAQGLHFEMERYFSAQLRKGDLFQILVTSQNQPVATGGVQWTFVPPSPRTPGGRVGFLVNFYCVPEARNQGIEEEILDRIEQEARRRHIDVLLPWTIDENWLPETHQ